MGKITGKLIEIQKELKAPKGQYNSFSKFKYRSAEDILEAVKPINAKHELLLTLSDEPVLVGDWHYIKATATISNGEENFCVTAFARESQVKKGMDDSQITGTASSYARKYALNGLYLIDDTKDADTDEYQKTSSKTQDNFKPITQKQAGLLKVKAKEFAKLYEDKSEEDVLTSLKISDISKLSQEFASKSIKQIETWITKASETK